jgi:hypothetical protein
VVRCTHIINQETDYEFHRRQLLEQPRPVSELELFRLAQNYYYDIFNNGVCNYEEEIWEMFRVTPKDADIESDDENLFKRTEPVMDSIILDAYAAEFTNKGGL